MGLTEFGRTLFPSKKGSNKATKNKMPISMYHLTPGKVHIISFFFTFNVYMLLYGYDRPTPSPVTILLPLITPCQPTLFHLCTISALSGQRTKMASGGAVYS